MTNTATAPKLTPARRKALLVLMDRHDVGRTGRVSNTTDVAEGHLYWQSAAWLVAEGLAAGIDGGPGGGPSHVYLRITPAGVEALAATFGAGGWREELARLRAAGRGGR